MSINTIKLIKYSDVIREHVAAAAIIPGALLKLDSSGNVINHNVAGGNIVPLMFALEDELQGKGINNNYVAGTPVQVWLPGQGDVVYALLNDDEVLAVGSLVESDGYGKVQAHVADMGDSHTGTVQNAIIGVVMEAVTAGNYGSGSESSGTGDYQNPRVKIMIK
jgi:hypothetical protein